MLYDTVTGEALNLGPGLRGHFSPDSRYVAWLSRSGEEWNLRVLDLETRERSLGTDLGPSGFVDDRTLLVQVSRSLEGLLVDVETGERRPTELRLPDSRDHRQGDLILEWGGPSVADGAYTWQLIEQRSGSLLAEFSATHAVFGAPGELLVATPWTGEYRIGQTEHLRSVPGIVNIYVVDIEAVEATFIATVALDQFPGLPLAGSETVIAWTETYCPYRLQGASDPQGVTWFFDRESGELVRLDRALWVDVTPDGRLGDGEVGPYRLIDRHTLQYEVVLPAGWNEVSWSPDYRYASQGETGGRGTRCPP